MNACTSVKFGASTERAERVEVSDTEAKLYKACNMCCPRGKKHVGNEVNSLFLTSLATGIFFEINMMEKDRQNNLDQRASGSTVLGQGLVWLG